jgi:thiol-disulfide isomerase/thioredoxin
MLTVDFLSGKFSQALSYADYVGSGKPEHQQRWQQFYDRVRLADVQRTLIQSFTRQMNVLVISGTWCGDCIQQVPFLQRIAEANPQRIDARYMDRDIHKDLSQQLRINAGDRVPVVVFMAEDFEFCAMAGDRTLSRYRAIAQRQLGASCSTGIIPPDQDEVVLTLADWVNEFERVQLMLRLSPRLRQKYGD